MARDRLSGPVVLPPLVLALGDPRRSRHGLVVLRDHEGALRVHHGTKAVPLPGSLLVSWPGGFPRTPADEELREAVVDAGGACFPLTRVLAGAGAKAGRGLEGLLGLLAPGVGEVEDPAHLGRVLLEGLEQLLTRFLEAGEVPAAPTARARLSPVLRDAVAGLPATPGVYRFLAADGRALYVGKARSLRRRVESHFRAGSEKGEALARAAHHLAWTEVGGELEALLVEHRGIRGTRPSLNVQEKVSTAPLPRASREGDWLLLQPAADPRRSALCVVTARGGFHWEEVPRRAAVPRETWRRVRALLFPTHADGRGGGWAPGGEGCALSPEEAGDLSEIALRWLVRHGEASPRLRVRPGETPGEVRDRLRALLGLDPRAERVEVR